MFLSINLLGNEGWVEVESSIVYEPSRTILALWELHLVRRLQHQLCRVSFVVDPLSAVDQVLMLTLSLA